MYPVAEVVFVHRSPRPSKVRQGSYASAYGQAHLDTPARRIGQLMDPLGAAALRDRIAQQRHWQLSAAVLEERLPRSDPDLAALQGISDEERLYEDTHGPFVKRLVDGAWQRFDGVGTASTAS